MLEVKYEDNVISVISDYNPMFVRKAKGLHGKWNRSESAWVFEASQKDAVRNILIDCYGDDGMSKSVKVHINLDNCDSVQSNENSLYLANKCLIATRFYRDSEVKLPYNVFCVDGCFRSYGGSMKHPRVTWDDGTIVEMDIPQAVFDECKGDKGISLVDDNANKRAALEEEKKKLLQRIEEIDKELSNIQ